ncbi:MAG: ATP-binding protein, partial [Candidatus Omnitrophica bacterium]|nr:ATP-binding protein [Candidatus Omnitrophota bacterium]
DFTSMVSHELRTPLTAIKEGISIVLDETTGALNKDQKNFLTIAKNNVHRLVLLISDILDIQKLESGKLEFKFKEHDITQLLWEVQSMMAAVAREKGLGFMVELQGDLPIIKFDRDRIIQVTMNLVGNAIKFTRTGGIAVAAVKKEDAILVSIRDTGSGIREKDIPKLFRKFVQLETGVERKAGGTGLGLAISKQIIEAHGGKIWVESHSGKGTTFYFTLPLVLVV